jgi:DNA modification methylase
LPEHPVSAAGDVWLLGGHRLVCGDAIDAEIVVRCLNGVSPHLMVTDPPYGVGYEPAWRNRVIPGDGTRVAARAKVRRATRPSPVGGCAHAAGLSARASPEPSLRSRVKGM